jgi:uncharacterized repeat protein (TIGR02543 family)
LVCGNCPGHSVVATFAVTVNGSHAATSGAANYRAGETVTISAGTRSGYNFGGWTVTSGGVTLASNSATTTFIMPGNTVAVTANWTFISTGGGNTGGSSGGGGGLVGRQVTTPSTTLTTTTNTTTTTPTNDSTAPGGNVTVTVTQNDSGVGASVSVSSGVSAGSPATVSVPLEIGDLNPNKFVATLEDGTIVGGSYNAATGEFTFATSVSGNFEISYVENLKRLSIQIGGNAITDLCGNAPTQTMDVPPMIVDGRTLLPVRFLSDALGANVGWNDATREVTLTVDGRTLVIPIGSNTPELSALGMEVPAQIIDGRTMVPLRFISEFFDAIVSWDETTRTVEIVSK